MTQRKKLSEKADKRRRAKVVVGHDRDGEPIVKYASGRTKAELEANKDELRRTYIGGEKIQRDVTFGEYAQLWFETYKKGRLSAGTDGNYNTALNIHLLPAFADRRLQAITAADLQRFMNSKSGLGKSSIGYLNTIIQHVFARAASEGIIDRNPAAGLSKPKTELSARRALTDNEISTTLAVGGTHPKGLLLLLLYYTGLRKGEAAGLRWSDVDFQNGMISVERDYDFKTDNIGLPKTKASIRTIPMPVELQAALKAVRGIGDAYIFQWLYTGRVAPIEEYSQAWDSLSAALIDYDKKIESRKGRSILTAHYYRHNYASILYNAGVDVLTAQRWLGHANVNTTLSIYAHLSKEKEMKNVDKLAGIFEKVAKRLPDKACEEKETPENA